MSPWTFNRNTPALVLFSPTPVTFNDLFLHLGKEKTQNYLKCIVKGKMVHFALYFMRMSVRWIWTLTDTKRPKGGHTRIYFKVFENLTILLLPFLLCLNDWCRKLGQIVGFWRCTHVSHPGCHGGYSPPVQAPPQLWASHHFPSVFT